MNLKDLTKAINECGWTYSSPDHSLESLRAVFDKQDKVLKEKDKCITKRGQEIATLKEKLTASETVREYYVQRLNELKDHTVNGGSNYQAWKKELDSLLADRLGKQPQRDTEDQKFFADCQKAVDGQIQREEINNAVADAVSLIYEETKDNRYSFANKKREEIINKIRKGEYKKS